MYFPQAGVEVQLWLPPLAAFVISFFTSMGGISGAFLLVPFQMSVLHVSGPTVSATNQFYNIVAIPGGVYRYAREGRLLWPLAITIAAGAVPGALIGAIIRVTLLPDKKHFMLFAALVLACIGLQVIWDILQKWKERETSGHSEKQSLSGPNALPSTVTVLRRGLRVSYTFQGRHFDLPVAKILALSAVVGVVGGIYGIGGGSIIAPVLTSCLGLPVHTVAGAVLLGSLATSMAGVSFYMLLQPFFPHLAVAPDWALGFLFGIGGILGMYLGARCQKYVPALAIKSLLAVVLLYTAGKYLADFFV